MAFAEVTQESHRRQCARYFAFLEEIGWAVDQPPSDLVLQAFLGWLLERRLQPRGYVAALSAWLKLAFGTSVQEISPFLYLRVRGAVRVLRRPALHNADPRGPTAPFGPVLARCLMRLIPGFPRPPHRLSDELEIGVMLLVGSCCLLRGGSLRKLTVGDVHAFGLSAFEIWDWHAKTDRFWRGQPHLLETPPAGGGDCDPATWLRLWLSVAHPASRPSDPLFWDLHADGRSPLSASKLTAIIREAVRMLHDRWPHLSVALPPPSRFNGRSSLRVGGAVALLEALWPEPMIKVAGRWRSDAFLAYLRSITVPWSVDPPKFDRLDALLRLSDPPFAVLRLP